MGMMDHNSLGTMKAWGYRLIPKAIFHTLIVISFFCLFITACTNLESRSDQRAIEIARFLSSAEKALDADAKLTALREAERLMRTAATDLPGTPLADAIAKNQPVAGKTLSEVRSMVWETESKTKFLKCGKSPDSVCVAELLKRTIIDAWNSHAFDNPDADRSDLSSAEGLLYDYLNSIGQKEDAQIYIRSQEKIKVDGLYPEWSDISGFEMFSLLADDQKRVRGILNPSLILAALARKGNYGEINEILSSKKFSPFIGAGGLSTLIRSKSFDMSKISPMARAGAINSIQDRIKSFDVRVKSFEVKYIVYTLRAFSAENVAIDLADRLALDWKSAISNTRYPLNIFNMTEAGIAIARLYHDLGMKDQSSEIVQALFTKFKEIEDKENIYKFVLHCEYLCIYLSSNQLRWLYENTRPEDDYGKSIILTMGLINDDFEFWQKITRTYIHSSRIFDVHSEHSITMMLVKHNLSDKFSDILNSFLVTQFKILTGDLGKISKDEMESYFKISANSSNLRWKLRMLRDCLLSLNFNFIREN